MIPSQKVLIKLDQKYVVKEILYSKEITKPYGLTSQLCGIHDEPRRESNELRTHEKTF